MEIDGLDTRRYRTFYIQDSIDINVFRLNSSASTIMKDLRYSRPSRENCSKAILRHFKMHQLGDATA